MNRFPGHLVASDPSNVGFWALQFISGSTGRPPLGGYRSAPKPPKWGEHIFLQNFIKMFPDNLVAPGPSNVGFWALQFISGPSSRPLEAHLDHWEPTGELLNPQNKEEIFYLNILWKDFLAIWWLLTAQMWDFGLSNAFLDTQVVLWKLVWTPGRLQESS